MFELIVQDAVGSKLVIIVVSVLELDERGICKAFSRTGFPSDRQVLGLLWIEQCLDRPMSRVSRSLGIIGKLASLNVQNQ